MAKAGRAVASNSDLQAFMGLDMISIARRLEILTKNRLLEMVDVAGGAKVYALPGHKEISKGHIEKSQGQVSQTDEGEKVYHLPWKDN
jgi:hypothetical protein